MKEPLDKNGNVVKLGQLVGFYHGEGSRLQYVQFLAQSIWYDQYRDFWVVKGTSKDGMTYQLDDTRICAIVEV